MAWQTKIKTLNCFINTILYFTKVFFDKEHSRRPGKYYLGKRTLKCSNSPCTFIFFWHPFSKCATKSCSPAAKRVIQYISWAEGPIPSPLCNIPLSFSSKTLGILQPQTSSQKGCSYTPNTFLETQITEQ